MRRTNRFRMAVVASVAAVALLAPAVACAMHALDISAPADEQHPFAVSFYGTFGSLSGEAKEIVYEDLVFGIDHKLSELDWDLADLDVGGLIVSAKFDFTRVVGTASELALNVGLWKTLNRGSGEMYDYDWYIPGMDWTHRSISDVKADATMFDMNACLTLGISTRFKIRGIAGINVNTWEWTDSVKSYVYSIYGYRDYVEEGDGSNMITYEQSYWFPYLGVGGEFDCGRFSVNGYMLLSSAVNAEDKDHHKLRTEYGTDGLHYEGTFSEGTYFALGLRAAYDITEAFFLTAAVDMQSVSEIRGDITIVELAEEYPNSAAVSHESSMFTVGAGLRL